VKINLTTALVGRRPDAQMGDDRSIDHADFGELPSMTETVEQPHATSRHDLMSRPVTVSELIGHAPPIVSRARHLSACGLQ
jgi:hypothetical protein